MDTVTEAEMAIAMAVYLPNFFVFSQKFKVLFLALRRTRIHSL